MANRASPGGRRGQSSRPAWHQALLRWAPVAAAAVALYLFAATLPSSRRGASSGGVRRVKGVGAVVDGKDCAQRTLKLDAQFIQEGCLVVEQACFHGQEVVLYKPGGGAAGGGCPRPSALPALACI